MKKIKIKFSNNFIIVELNNSDTAKKIYASCPIKSTTNTWGNEIYFETAIKVKKDKTAKDIINLGEIAYWFE